MLRKKSRDSGFLGICAIGVAVVTIGCSETTPNPILPTALSETRIDTTVSQPGASRSVLSLEEAAFAGNSLVAAVRQATARFHDVDKAIAAGYTTANEPCVASPAGAMGVHAPNLALINNQSLIPTQPELLLYIPKPNGELRLVGVEYLKVVLLRNLATGAIAPWFNTAPWDPAQYQVIDPTPQLFGQTFQGPMPGHTPTMPWHWDLHAWIWAPNPSGMFAQWNPALSCE